ncbi:MAG: CD1375 family protein [Acutalibacteraceae bacterium]
MAKVYAELIRKGLKTLDDVPERLREEVRRILEEDEVEGVRSAFDFFFDHSVERRSLIWQSCMRR